jgi:5-formyltetrahydrofolate cyclo-ligase
MSNPLRQQIRKKLRTLTPEICVAASQKITSEILESEVFSQSQNIACYVPIENEIDVWPIIKTIWLLGKNCYLPVIDPTKKHSLQFVKFNEHNELIIAKCKIPQPKICPEKIITPHNLDLAIVPLIGFNDNLFRLGRGTGHYDRAFELKRQTPKAKPYLLGVGYEWQGVEFEPKQWDVKMDAVVTG